MILGGHGNDMLFLMNMVPRRERWRRGCSRVDGVSQDDGLKREQQKSSMKR